MNMNKTKILTNVLVILLMTLSLVTAMSVKSIESENFAPGNTQTISINVKNNLEINAEEVYLELIMPENNELSLVSSEEETKDIDEDDTESFDFTIKASSNAKAGDYKINYKINYQDSLGETQPQKEGTFILTIEANPELAYTIDTDKPIIGSQGKIKLSIINKGLGDAKFVSVKIIPVGYTILSANEEYIGTVSSDDFEIINLDVIFEKENPVLSASIEYRDFENKKIVKNINLPVTVYSREEALNLGLISKNNSAGYVIFGLACIVGFFIVRKIKKKRKQNKLKGN